MKPLKWLERRIDRSADAVITSSRNAERALRDAIGDQSNRIVTVADAVNTVNFAPANTEAARLATGALKGSLGIPADRKVVAYLGLLAHYQGTDLLLEAASIIINEMGRRDVHFLIM